MLESLIRLAEAHARLMFKKEIEVYDAICVVILMEHCINTGLYDKPFSCLMSRELYSQAKRETLEKLGLDRDFFCGEDKDPYDVDYLDQDDDGPNGPGGNYPYVGVNMKRGNKRNNLNMMGEDTMLMIGDHTTVTDLQTNTFAPGVDKTALAATEVPTHFTRHDVTQNDTTVVILDSQPSDDRDGSEDNQIPPTAPSPRLVPSINKSDTHEFGSSIALSEHTRMRSVRDSGM